jgi:signal transduction histidine kinase
MNNYQMVVKYLETFLTSYATLPYFHKIYFCHFLSMRKIALYFSTFFLFFSCHPVGPIIPVTTASFDSVLTKAEHIYDAGNKMQALSLVISAHSRIKKPTVEDEMNYFTYTSHIYRTDFNDNDRYVACADSMISILEKSGEINEFSGRLVQAYNMKADALFSKGLYNESYDFYYRAKALAKEKSDSCSLSKFSYSLGMVVYKQQRYPEAAFHFIESFNESSACKDNFLFFYHRQELLDNIGLSYNGAHKYDSALIYYARALAYIDSNYLRFNNKKESAYITAKAVIYGNMGDVYIALNRYDTATVLLKKSIAINLQKGYTNSDALTDQVKLANLYLKTGNVGGMKEVLQQIRVELDSIPDKNVALSWNRLMWQYYDQEKDSLRADRYLRIYVTLNDSAASQNNLLMASDVDARIKSIERQNSINTLNRNNALGKVFLAVAIIILTLALIIIGMILRNAVKTKANVRQLTVLNRQISEQKNKLEKALDQLEAKDQEKTRILRSVAHDVMNPIAAIMSLTDILIGESDKYTDEQKEIFQMIKEACGNSLGLSKDILEASLSLDPASMAREWLDINLLVANSVKLLNIRAAAKHQRLVITSGKKELQAYVNKKKIWRLVNNLIVNAIKFSFDHSDIEINAEEVAGHVHISVRDYGTGIPENNKPYIFDMFTSAKTPGTSGEVPHGLGLSISSQIARAHNGNIWFDSEEGQGSTFHLLIPLNPDMQA